MVYLFIFPKIILKLLDSKSICYNFICFVEIVLYVFDL